jgi:hypothetical protein
MPSLADAPAERDPRSPDRLGSPTERMLREMAEALEALTAEMPLILVLEDLHWSDYSTLDLIASLARRREPARLLVLGTFRPVDVIVRGHPLRGVKQELAAQGQCEELQVEPLTGPAVTDYLSRRFPGGAVPPELARIIHRRTDGHPLFMVSLVDYLLASGALGQVDGQWSLKVEAAEASAAVPDSVREVIERQFEELGQAERDLLETASAAGLEFAAAVVAAAVDDSVVAVEALCQPLVRSGRFLASRGVAEWPAGPPSERYGFVHALHRDALYERLSAARRQDLHRRIGETTERFRGPHAREVAAELAMHFEKAREVGRAVHYLALAADNAARRHANRDAADHVSRALDLLARAPESDPELSLGLLERRGTLRRAMGQIAAAADDFEALARRARERGRTEHEAKALFYLASAVFAVDGDRCLHAAERAVELSRVVGDELFEARTRGSSGYWHSVLRGWRADDAAACEQAVLAARSKSDRALLSLLLARSSYFRRLAGAYGEALATAEEGLELALEVGDAYEYLFCQYTRSQALFLLGRWGETLRVTEAAGLLAAQNDSPLWQVFFRLATATVHLHAGDAGTARELASRAVDDARAIPHPYGELLALIALAGAERALGGLGAATRRLESVTARIAGGGPRDCYLRMPALHALAECRLERGDLADAGRLAAEVWETARQPGEPTWMALAAHVEAQAAAAGGDVGGAAAAIARGIECLAKAEAPVAARSGTAAAIALRVRAASRAGDDALRQRLLASGPARVVVARAGAPVDAAERGGMSSR